MDKNITQNTTLPNAEIRRKERVRRNHELLAAGLMLSIVLISSWLQINHYGSSNSLFLFSLNLNTVLLLAVCFLITKNLYRIFLERRRKLFGAKLRSRLVAAFMAVAIIPIALMFFAANQLISSRLDYLFTGETSESMRLALDLARQQLTEQQRILHEQAMSFLENSARGTDAAAIALENSGLSRIAILHGPDPGQTAPTVQWQAKEGPFAWSAVESLFNYEDYGNVGHTYAIHRDLPAVRLLGLIRLDPDKHVLAVRELDALFVHQLDTIAQGYENYAQMRSLHKPIRYSYTLMLGILSLTVVLLAMWLALRLSRQITGPIVALSKGAEQLARGDLNLRLLDEGRDELGQLVSSFNTMVEELKTSHENLLRSNQLLASQSEDLAQRNQFIETVLESVSTGILTMGPEGKILTMNKALVNMLQIRAEEWLGIFPEQRLAPEYAKKILQIRSFLMNNPDQIWQDQVEFVRFGRNIKLFAQALRLPDNLGNVQTDDKLLFLLDDITELASLQRLEAWQEVAQRIAHEVKNPLTPIKLSAQRLERRFGPEITDPVFGECTSLIIMETERMRNLVSDFTSFASLPKVKPSSNNLDLILDEAINVMQSGHEQTTWLKDCPADLPPMDLDPEAMHRAILNLLTNSAEALNLFPEQAAPLVQIRVSRAPDQVLLEIQDNGPGLNPEDIPRLFEPYFSRKKGGTGLGLAIAKAILHEHGAEIHAFNIPGGGALIRVEFKLNYPN